MAMTATPVFVQTPVSKAARVTTAVTARAQTSSGTNMVALTDASTNGKRCDAIQIKAEGTTTAGYIWIWLYDGTNYTLQMEIAVEAKATVDATANPSFEKNITFGEAGAPPPFNIKPTHQLFVSTTVTQNIDVTSFTWDW